MRTLRPLATLFSYSGVEPAQIRRLQRPPSLCVAASGGALQAGRVPTGDGARWVKRGVLRERGKGGGRGAAYLQPATRRTPRWASRGAEI